ncbi:MAG: DUF4174 domain-containing protein [Oleiphilaceae bacterium]|nr:DUF4174 domain-containing protein [Oleiphilaceae bacterium]
MNALSDLQWKNRIILVKTSGDGIGVMKTLNQAREDIKGRDIAWFVVTGKGIESNLPQVSPDMAESVRDFFADEPHSARVILIGKDGGVKDRGDHLNLERIFAQIDRMPMRKQEVRRGEP